MIGCCPSVCHVRNFEPVARLADRTLGANQAATAPASAFAPKAAFGGQERREVRTYTIDFMKSITCRMGRAARIGPSSDSRRETHHPATQT
jgi:hypothetical protein